MGEGDSRVVTAPANKATAYGIVAAVNSAARAVGDAVDVVVDAIVDKVGLQAAAKQAPAPAWVVGARKIWVELAKGDASLGPTVLADLKWYASFAETLSGKSAVGELDKVGFNAWTNSSSLVLVDESLFAIGPDVARVLLNHEAQHVRTFLVNGNSPPTSYLAMARFESTAYSRTLTELTPLKARGGAHEHAWNFIDHLVKFFASAYKLSSEAEVRQALLDYEDVDRAKSPLLPPSAGDKPSSLYVP